MWQNILKADITTTRVILLNYDDEEAYTHESDVEWSYDIKESEGGIKLDIEIYSFTNLEGMTEIWNNKFHSLELSSWDDFSEKYMPYHVKLEKGKYEIKFREG